jgi:hypothetical protein
VTKIVPSLWPKNTLLGESCFWLGEIYE